MPQTTKTLESGLDGPAIRNANRCDSRESIRRETPIFITFERFARIASNLRFEFLAPRSAIRKQGVQLGNPEGDSRESANLFARIGPSKTKTSLRQLQKEELSAGLAEITETTDMMATTGIQGANHTFLKQRV